MQDGWRVDDAPPGRDREPSHRASASA